jgi:hypothetical protein
VQDVQAVFLVASYFRQIFSIFARFLISQPLLQLLFLLLPLHFLPSLYRYYV